LRIVKESVNWALRYIGKRNETLHETALAVAENMAKSDSNAARWIASDAIRELTSEAIVKRLGIAKND